MANRVLSQRKQSFFWSVVKKVLAVGLILLLMMGANLLFTSLDRTDPLDDQKKQETIDRVTNYRLSSL